MQPGLFPDCFCINCKFIILSMKQQPNIYKERNKNMTKKEMENKKAECIAAGRVKVVEKTDTEEALLEFFRNYKEPWLLVITVSNKELLLDYTEIKDCNGVFVKAYCTWRNEDEALILLHIKCDCFNDENGEFDDSLFWCSNFCIRTFLRDYDYPEITNGITSIYLDEFNISCWRDVAKRIEKQYQDDRVPTTKISGIEYCKRINQMIDIAEKIIKKEMIPNIFDLIPIKKDGTFQVNRTIPIFSNGIGRTYSFDAGGDYYSEKARIQLCIISECESLSDCDVLEDISRGRLIIRSRDNVPKRELLNPDMTVNNLRRR